MADKAPELNPAAAVGELVAVITSGVTGVLKSAIKAFEKAGVAETQIALVNVGEDIGFGYRHQAVVWADKLVDFWQFCIWSEVLFLIYTYFAKRLILTTPGSFFVFLLCAFGITAVKRYAWPVKSVGALEYRKQRQHVDAARRLVAQLEAQTHKTAYRHTPSNHAALVAARQEVQTRQTAFNLWVASYGANDRSPVVVLKWGWIFSVVEGFALLYGIVGRHDNGPYTYEQVLPYLISVCLLPVALLLMPMVLAIWTTPATLSQVAKGENILTFLRQLLKAGIIIGQVFKDIVQEELKTAKENGDDVLRNATQIFKQRIVVAMGIVGLKVLAAQLLVIHHGLFFPSAAAFLCSSFLAFFAVFLQAVLEKHNVGKEAGPPIVTVVTVVGGFSIYLHFGLAGGAPEGLRGFNWWSSELGPFGSLIGPKSVAESYDAVHGATTSVVRPVGQFVYTVWGLGFAEWLLLTFALAIMTLIVVKISRMVSQEVEESKNPTFKKFSTIAAAVLLGVLAMGALGVAVHLPSRIQQAHVVDGANVPTIAALPVLRPMTIETSAANDSTVAQPTLQRVVETRTGDLDRDCRKIEGRIPCTPECFGYQDPPLLATPDALAVAARDQHCRVVPWHHVIPISAMP